MTVSGDFYQFLVEWDSVHISGSPYPLTIGGGLTCATRSTHFGSTLSLSSAGVAATFAIITRDIFDNVITDLGDSFSIAFNPSNARDPDDQTIVPQVLASSYCSGGPSSGAVCTATVGSSVA